MNLGDIVNSGFELYRNFNQVYPVLGSIATAGVIFPLSDLASQLINDHRVDWAKVGYTTALSPVYGIATYACINRGDLSSAYPLGKAVAANLYGQVFNAFFFANNTIGEREDYNLGSLVRHYQSLFFVSERRNGFQEEVKSSFQERFFQCCHDLYRNFKNKFIDQIPKKEYLYAFVGSMTFWNAFQWFNYSYIPPEMRTPTSLGVAFAWTILLSTWSLIGRRKIVGLEQKKDYTRINERR